MVEGMLRFEEDVVLVCVYERVCFVDGDKKVVGDLFGEVWIVVVL